MEKHWKYGEHMAIAFELTGKSIQESKERKYLVILKRFRSMSIPFRKSEPNI
jgi:hypothetical protein